MGSIKTSTQRAPLPYLALINIYFYTSHLNISIMYAILSFICLLESILIIACIRTFAVVELVTIGSHGIIMVFLVLIWLSYSSYANINILSYLLGEFIYIRINILGIIISDYLLYMIELSFSSCGWTLYTSLSILLVLFEALIIVISSNVTITLVILYLCMCLLLLTSIDLSNELLIINLVNMLLLLVLPIIIITLVLITINDLDSLLFSILFWIFGHPEVYILLLISIVVIFNCLSVFSCVLLISASSICVLGCLVYIHHVYLVSLLEIVNIHNISTVSIALPSAIKIFYLA